MGINIVPKKSWIEQDRDEEKAKVLGRLRGMSLEDLKRIIANRDKKEKSQMSLNTPSKGLERGGSVKGRPAKPSAENS